MHRSPSHPSGHSFAIGDHEQDVEVEHGHPGAPDCAAPQGESLRLGVHPVPAEAVCVQLTTDCTQTLARPLSRARSSGWQGHRLLQAVAAATAGKFSQSPPSSPAVGGCITPPLPSEKEGSPPGDARQQQNARAESFRYSHLADTERSAADAADKRDAPPPTALTQAEFDYATSGVAASLRGLLRELCGPAAGPRSGGHDSSDPMDTAAQEAFPAQREGTLRPGLPACPPMQARGPSYAAGNGSQHARTVLASSECVQSPGHAHSPARPCLALDRSAPDSLMTEQKYRAVEGQRGSLPAQARLVDQHALQIVAPAARMHDGELPPLSKRVDHAQTNTHTHTHTHKRTYTNISLYIQYICTRIHT